MISQAADLQNVVSEGGLAIFSPERAAQQATWD
jgi:hypothetical protein